MRFRTLALAMAIGLALSAGAEARKKGPHSSPPTAKSMKKGRKFKPAAKGRKVKTRKLAKHQRGNR
jgi:hypothetical protein